MKERERYLPGEFVNFGDEVVFDDVERVLGGQQLVVLLDQVLHLLAHTCTVKSVKCTTYIHLYCTMHHFTLHTV